MQLEEVYQRLKEIKSRAHEMTDEAFDKTKAFKFVYNNLLDLIDDLEYLEDDNELLDDDFFETKIPQEKHIEKSIWIIDPDDLI